MTSTTDQIEKALANLGPKKAQAAWRRVLEAIMGCGPYRGVGHGTVDSAVEKLLQSAAYHGRDKVANQQDEPVYFSHEQDLYRAECPHGRAGVVEWRQIHPGFLPGLEMHVPATVDCPDVCYEKLGERRVVHDQKQAHLEDRRSRQRETMS